MSCHKRTVHIHLRNSSHTFETQEDAFVLTPQGVQSFEADFKIKNPTLWQGRKNPYLYKIVSRLIRNGKVIDEVVQPFGLRKYEIVAGEGFYLNGEKYPISIIVARSKS